jgi:hypothetical protein
MRSLMPKRKKTKPVGPVEDLPKNPEFQEFSDFTRKLLQVPKEEIDRRVAADKLSRERKREP